MVCAWWLEGGDKVVRWCCLRGDSVAGWWRYGGGFHLVTTMPPHSPIDIYLADGVRFSIGQKESFCPIR